MDIFKIFKGKKDTKAPIPQGEKIRLNKELDKNLDMIKKTLGNTNDLMIRRLQLQGDDGVNVAVLGIDGLVDTNQAQHFIVHVLAIDLSLVNEDETRSNGVFQSIFESRISMMDAKCGRSIHDV